MRLKIPIFTPLKSFFMPEENISMKFIDVLKEYLNKEQKDNNLSWRTQIKHKGHLSNINAFLKATGNHSLLISEIKIKHLEVMRTWLYTYRKIKSYSHVTRHIRHCIAAADHAIRMEYVQYHQLGAIKLKRDKDPVIVYLDTRELSLFESYDSTRIIWQQVKDLFLLQCYTGLSYMDIWLFELMDDVIIAPDGAQVPITWVTCMTGRGKTKRKYWAELVPEAKALIDKYEGQMPYIGNQVYNKTVKKIIKDLGITKHITTHVARKTFATLKRRHGYSVPAIADMLGNTEAVARKSYIERSKELVASEILRLRRPTAHKIAS